MEIYIVEIESDGILMNDFKILSYKKVDEIKYDSLEEDGIRHIMSENSKGKFYETFYINLDYDGKIDNLTHGGEYEKVRNVLKGEIRNKHIDDILNNI